MDRAIIVFGEVLFDSFPDGKSVMGGAPFNVAWNLKGLGLDPLFVSRIGDDSLGQAILGAMNEHGMDTSWLQVDTAHPTGQVQVSINNNEPSFEILPEQAYDYIDKHMPGGLPGEGTVYHGTLALRSAASAEALGHIRQQCRGEVFVDINLRSPWWSKEIVDRALRGSTWAKLNIDELGLIAGEEVAAEAAAKRLLRQYSLRHVIVTMGVKGAFLLTSEGQRLDITPSASADIVDTVGAGDAFSSVMLLGHTLGWPAADSLGRAQEFAQAVVGMRGATTTDNNFYDRFKNNWRV